MKSGYWEAAWREKHTQQLWLTPEPEIVVLLETLRRENVKRILDLGFGLGRHVLLFSREGFETFGIEPMQSGLDYCQTWLKVEALTADIRLGEMTALPYENEFFDFVISWNVIYHGSIQQLRKAFTEIHRVTRPRGLAYITLNSIRNNHYGQGTEIEPNTFLNPEKPDGDLLHHYSDEQEVKSLFERWEILRMKEAEQSLRGKTYRDSYHWTIFARKG